MKNPVFKINEHGEWFYRNSKIARLSLVKLFSSILVRYDDGSYHLKTPVEDEEILVEDVPFFIINSSIKKLNNQIICLETNVGDLIEIGKSNPIWVEKNIYNEGLVPYVLVRSGIIAKISRPVYYDLAKYIVEKEINGCIKNVLESNNYFFDLDTENKREKFLS